MKKILNWINEYKIFLIVLVISFIIFNIKLPYYIMAPGGIINITNRIEVENNKAKDGSINLLYVSEYDGTIAALVMAKIFKEWDIKPLEDMQVSDEDSNEIHERNKLMLENSIDIATIVAFRTANKDVNITGYENRVIATTNDNGLKIGDIILEVNNKDINNVSEIRKIISDCEIGEEILIKIIRDVKEKEIKVKVREEDGEKIIGVVVLTNYEYELNPKINIKFKSSEGGSSGGLMTTLAIYNSIADEDILKGRNISGTGTISIDGTVGEIDGIKYKIMGAVENNIDIVLVPSGNYEEALEVKEKYHYDIEIVKIDNFTDALEYLR